MYVNYNLSGRIICRGRCPHRPVWDKWELIAGGCGHPPLRIVFVKLQLVSVILHFHMVFIVKLCYTTYIYKFLVIDYENLSN